MTERLNPISLAGSEKVVGDNVSNLPSAETEKAKASAVEQSDSGSEWAKKVRPKSPEAPHMTTDKEILFRLELQRELGAQRVGKFSPEGLAAYQLTGDQSFFVDRNKQSYGMEGPDGKVRGFERTYAFKNGFGRIEMQDGWRLVNAPCVLGEEGAKAFGPFLYVGEFLGGKAPVKRAENEWGFIDAEGKDVGWGPFESVFSSWDEFSLVKKDGKKMILNGEGKEVELPGIAPERVLAICEGYVMVTAHGSGRQFIGIPGTKTEGKRSQEFRFAFELSHGLAPIEQYGSDGWVYVDPTVTDDDGNWLPSSNINMAFKFAHPYFEDKAMVSYGGGALGEIDIQGREVPKR